MLEQVVASSPRPDMRRLAQDALDRGTLAALGAAMETRASFSSYAAKAVDHNSDPAALPVLERAQEIGDAETRLASRLVARRLRRLANSEGQNDADPSN